MRSQWSSEGRVTGTGVGREGQASRLATAASAEAACAGAGWPVTWEAVCRVTGTRAWISDASVPARSAAARRVWGVPGTAPCFCRVLERLEAGSVPCGAFAPWRLLTLTATRGSLPTAGLVSLACCRPWHGTSTLTGAGTAAPVTAPVYSGAGWPNAVPYEDAVPAPARSHARSRPFTHHCLSLLILKTSPAW